MPGIIGLDTLGIATDYNTSSGAILDTRGTYTVVADDFLESGFFYCRGGGTGSRSLVLGLYDRTNGDALITTVNLTVPDLSVVGWTEVSVNLDLTPYIGNELAIGLAGDGGIIPTFRSSSLNHGSSASTTLDDPFVIATTDARMYAGYFNVTAGIPTPTVRKTGTFTVETALSGTVTAATLNGQAITVDSHVGTTVTLTDSDGTITTSGTYDLVLTDDSADPDETTVVQVNVFGVAPSNNPLQKDGAALASLTAVEVRVSNGATLAGTELFYSGTATTDASGNLGNIDLSSTAAADTDPVLLSIRTAAGDSIIAAETVGLI